MDYLETGLERIQELRHAPTPGDFLKARIAAVAEALSLAGLEQLYCEFCNEVLNKVALFLYRRDSDGYLPHVDPVSHRIIVAMPWGSIGWADWGLRQWEGDVLRMCLLERSAQPDPPRPPLFYYAGEARRWHLDIAAYGNLALAQRYLKMETITLETWRKHHAAWREFKQSENIANRERRQSKGLP